MAGYHVHRFLTPPQIPACPVPLNPHTVHSGQCPSFVCGPEQRICSGVRTGICERGKDGLPASCLTFLRANKVPSPPGYSSDLIWPSRSLIRRDRFCNEWHNREKHLLRTPLSNDAFCSKALNIGKMARNQAPRKSMGWIHIMSETLEFCAIRSDVG